MLLRLLCKRLWTLLISGSLVILQYVLAPTQELSVASLNLTHKQFWNTVEVLASSMVCVSACDLPTQEQEYLKFESQ